MEIGLGVDAVGVLVEFERKIYRTPFLSNSAQTSRLTDFNKLCTERYT